MDTQPLGIIIPPDVDFSQLQYAREADGSMSFDWAPIERICEASGVDVAVFRNGPEDNVAALLATWYASHIDGGGARDTAFDDLVDEARIEDERGGGISHAPGRA